MSLGPGAYLSQAVNKQHAVAALVDADHVDYLKAGQLHPVVRVIGCVWRQIVLRQYCVCSQVCVTAALRIGIDVDFKLAHAVVKLRRK